MFQQYCILKILQEGTIILKAVFDYKSGKLKHQLLSLNRFYLISGGVPFIICGITAATNINNYGIEGNAP